MPLVAFSQAPSITGKVSDARGESLPGIMITLKETSAGAASNEKGEYRITGVSAGTYTLTVSGVGYAAQQKSIILKENQHLALDFTLTESSTELESVTVVSKSNVQEIKETPFELEVVDARKLHNTTLDLAHALDRVSGVRLRENGGVGSTFNFSLNGFTGKQVKFFLDGMPIDNLGSSFQINNIPVNLAERIEVYKGVVPISFGADALGGVVNIVTNQYYRNYLDVSYSYGSFNTHKSSVNAGFTSNAGVTFQLNAFQNYSDNNYWVDVDIADLETGLYTPGRVRRFHDNYHNETIIAHVGIVGKSFADRLVVGVTMGENEADIQTGNRMYEVYGQRRRRGNIVMPSVKYSKRDLFVKGLELSVNGNYNFGWEQVIDTVFAQYNWAGDSINKGKPFDPGGESARTLYKFYNNLGIATGNLGYRIHENHLLTFTNTFSTFNREGKDQLDPENESNMLPSRSDKNIMGLGYTLTGISKWNFNLFVKQYTQKNTYHDIFDDEYIIAHSDFSERGYGVAAAYFVTPRIQLKTSYEKSYRLPDNDEMFGDAVNQTSNVTLRPEGSKNINVGFNFNPVPHQKHRVSFESNFLYRDASDFIRPSLATTFGKAILRMVNLRDVTTTGVDGEVTYAYKELLKVGANVTYQNIRNNTKYEGGATSVSPVYKDRIPNMPYLFGNGNVSVLLSKFKGDNNTLSFDYNVLYVHEYYLRWPSQGADKITIPGQVAHDVSVNYSLASGKYNISIECRNLTDATLYDNYSLQKPSRSFNIKLRYFLLGKAKSA
jgi:outer membrane receptor protein involved in Fe transport